MKSITLLVATLLGCTACGKSVPSCSESDVTEVVEQLASQQFANQLWLKRKLFDDFGDVAALASNINLGFGNHEKMKELAAMDNLDEVARNKGYSKQTADALRKDVAIAEEILDKMKFKLSDFRTQGTRKEAKTVGCIARLTVNNGDEDIVGGDVSYTAQHTDDDGRVYVEVIGGL